MDRNFVAALAVLVVLASGALYFLDAAHERQVADLRKQLEAARQQAAESDKARKAAERGAVEKARSEGGEISKAGEPPMQQQRADGEAQREAEAQKAAADAARQAREAARAEAMQMRIEAARKRAEEETRAKDRVDQPKLPEFRLSPKAGS